MRETASTDVKLDSCQEGWIFGYIPPLDAAGGEFPSLWNGRVLGRSSEQIGSSYMEAGGEGFCAATH